MLFCLLHWNGIEGIQFVLTGCVLCLSAFTIPRCCVSWKGIKRWGVAMLSCELLCSIVWQIVFSVSHAGLLQGVLLCMLYPVSLAAAWVIIALYPKIKAKNKERL